MTKRRARLKNKGSGAARRSSVVEIPEDLAAAIKRCWPRGVVEEFPADEFWDEETGEAVSANEYHRDLLGQEVFQKLEIPRQEIVSIMSSHRISVLDEFVLDLPVKGLRADREVFLGKPLRVRDAFFFRGV